MEICELCGGTLIFLEVMGDLLHFKCQNCGIQVNVPATPSQSDSEKEEEEEEEDGES